jgi:hypothetical protein
MSTDTTTRADIIAFLKANPEALAEVLAALEPAVAERLRALRGAWRDFALSVSLEGLAKQSCGSRQATIAYTTLRRAIDEVLEKYGEL